MNNISTRLLMSCAAIGVAGGVLFTAHALIGGLAVNTVPFLYGLTMGIYFLPGTLAQALFRRGGVGLLTSALAGLVSSPFQPIGFTAFLIGLGIGVMQEVPFLIGRYRYWKPWLFWVAGLVQGLLVSGAGFGILRGQDLTSFGAILVIASFFVSPPIFTAIALWLAGALDRAGVARGLRLDEDRRGRPDSAS
ncbi:acyl esterase [Gulosibacter macacae]|uniref:Acyl esterase n=1 Tax=Gulosibacter macacae TaxID=2488791 RepID=A0A3P3VW80_9MICO|nr:ECF transporter S component [Gulosibacter macacae]RRJ87055.1 acyl esterase [Gulosibacter macacae]